MRFLQKLRKDSGFIRIMWGIIKKVIGRCWELLKVILGIS